MYSGNTLSCISTSWNILIYNNNIQYFNHDECHNNNTINLESCYTICDIVRHKINTNNINSWINDIRLLHPLY